MTHASAGQSGTLLGKFGSLSYGVIAPFSWVLVCTSFCCTLQESGPQSCGSSVIKSHWPSNSNSLGFLSPFAGSSGWEICCGSQNFCKRARLLWCKCSPICGLSAWHLYSGDNGDLLQEDLCHTSQVCCSQRSCPRSRPLLTHASTGDT